MGHLKGTLRPVRILLPVGDSLVSFACITRGGREKEGIRCGWYFFLLIFVVVFFPGYIFLFVCFSNFLRFVLNSSFIERKKAWEQFYFCLIYSCAPSPSSHLFFLMFIILRGFVRDYSIKTKLKIHHLCYVHERPLNYFLPAVKKCPERRG